MQLVPQISGHHHHHTLQRGRCGKGDKATQPIGIPGSRYNARLLDKAVGAL